MTRGKLPLGIQNFEELRKGGYLYADKTDMVWQIANGDKYNFLSRPRRFGKSLLVSTLQCYFEGKKELFEGLKIMELEKDWIKRPVIHFSMNLGGSDAESLYHYLDDTLTKYEEIYGKRATEATLSNRFTGIIERAYQQSGEQVAVLVDEYDAPLQHSYLTDRHEKCRNLYRDFFTGLKDYGYCIKCVFLTGITKFTQISLFSVLNTLSNISFYNCYATICGLTKEEILENLKDEIQVLAVQKKWDIDQTMHELKDMYDGYHFSESLQGVYNPFSVISALKERRLRPYWIASGATEMLPKILTNFEERCRNTGRQPHRHGLHRNGRHQQRQSKAISLPIRLSDDQRGDWRNLQTGISKQRSKESTSRVGCSQYAQHRQGRDRECYSRPEAAFYPWQFRGGRNLPEATHRQHSLQYSEERTVCL